MKKTLLLSLFLLSVNIFAETSKVKTDISCRIFGMLDQEKWEYKTLVKGKLSFSPDEIKNGQRSKDGSCTPEGITTKVFGKRDGTQLQISANKCGSDDVYEIARLTINGKPHSLYLDKDKYSRLLFNQDLQDENEERLDPIQTPEGTFKFIYFDCTRTQSAKLTILTKKIDKEKTVKYNFLSAELLYHGLNQKEVDEIIKMIVNKKLAK